MLQTASKSSQISEHDLFPSQVLVSPSPPNRSFSTLDAAEYNAPEPGPRSKTTVPPARPCPPPPSPLSPPPLPQPSTLFSCPTLSLSARSQPLRPTLSYPGSQTLCYHRYLTKHVAAAHLSCRRPPPPPTNPGNASLIDSARPP